MRVRLIPTGQAELQGLAGSLSRLFPGHDFRTVHRGVRGGQREPFDGFTSGRLRAEIIPDSVINLVEQLASEVHPGRGGEKADLAIIIDDLELANYDQPDVVIDIVRGAVRSHLAKLERDGGTSYAGKVREALLRRASFHLAVPMLEAWFFPDPAALKATGIPEHRLPPKLREGDPEAFETDDQEYSDDDGEYCATWQAAIKGGRAKKQDRPVWLASRPGIPPFARERHPKAYLSWLCRASEAKRCTTYKEARDGVAALEVLHWQRVLGNPAWCAFARSFLADIADALGQPPSEAIVTLKSPGLLPHARDIPRVLRNL